MTVSICKLRNLNIVRDDGTLVDYTYTADQSALIIQSLRRTLQKYNLLEYLRTPCNLPYPDCIVRQIIRKHRDVLCKLDIESVSEAC